MDQAANSILLFGSSQSSTTVSTQYSVRRPHGQLKLAQKPERVASVFSTAVSQSLTVRSGYCARWRAANRMALQPSNLLLSTTVFAEVEYWEPANAAFQASSLEVGCLGQFFRCAPAKAIIVLRVIYGIVVSCCILVT